MPAAVLILSFYLTFFRLAVADDAVPVDLTEHVEKSGENLERHEETEQFDSAVALMDPDSGEDAPDPVDSNGEMLIRAKRYCGYGSCCGCNCNCATMAPVTYGPCGCCGCGYG